MKNTSPNADTNKSLAIQSDQTAMTVQQVLGQVALIQQIMGTAMQDGVHFGRIPGCGDKPTLLKPGAEKLCLTFRLAPTYTVQERLLDGGHREYTITCKLTSILSGACIGEGVGFGSTMESKYRFTKGEGEATDSPVPRAYWDIRGEDPAKAQALIGGKGFSVKKVDGKGWMIAKGGEKVENTNPADQTNTVLKMCKKRALVDAVLTATAASDLMTQDLEDIRENIAANTPPTAVPNPAIAGIKAACPAVQTLTEATAATTAADEDLPSWEEAQPAANTEPSVDFRETRVHFGKNRGLMISELSPQQVHWYETDWMPKKEVNGPTSVEDLVLIAALKEYRKWRSDHHGAHTVKPVQKRQ